MSDSARALFRAAAAGDNQILVPAIVIAALIKMVEKRRTTLNATSVITALKRAAGFEIVPLTIPIVTQIEETVILPYLQHRLLAAAALSLDATLITQDQAITHSDPVPTIW